MRRTLAWAALAALMVCAIYGLVHERLFHQFLWTPEGAARWIWYSAVFWIVAGIAIWFRPRWLAAVASLTVLIYTVWWCWRFYQPAAPLAVIYFLGSSFLLGRFVARRTDGITALLLGLAIWIGAISIAIYFPVNTRVVYAGVFAIPYLIEWRRLGDHFRGLRFQCESRREAAALAVLLFVLLMEWLIALKPEVSSDGLAMHLAIPMSVAHNARWFFDFRRYTWALMPMGGDWAFTSAYLLGGEAAARLLNFAFLVAIVAMVYQSSRRWLRSPAAFLAAALFASTPLVQLGTGSLFVENAWAMMILGGALALCRREAVWAGILFGSAFSIKVGTMAFLAPAAVIGVVVLAKIRDPRQRWRTAALATALFAVFAAPPYVNAWWKTGNPVYPFFNNVFRSPYFETSPTAVRDTRFHRDSTWKTPYEATFRSKEYFEGQNGSLGFQYFVLLIPLFLTLDRRSPRALLALGVVGAVLTFMSLPNMRYLYPALPFFSIGMAWLISEIPAVLIVAVALTALNVWFFPASSWYHQDFALFRRAQMERYLREGNPQRTLIEYLNRNAPGESVAFFGGDAIAGLNARAYTDTWHTYEYWKRLIHSPTPQEIAATFRELGIKHVIAPIRGTGSDYPIVQYFLEQWTTPTGVTSSDYALRDVVPSPMPQTQWKTAAGAGICEDTDPKIEYSGAWALGRFKEASGGSVTFSDQAGGALRFVFNGSAIAYVYTKALNRGTAEVFIDGHARPAISLYSHGTEWQAQTVFSDLGLGPHTIEVRVLKQKNPQSSGYYVDLDRFVVSK